jgi:anti-sigma factor RsiW
MTCSSREADLALYVEGDLPEDEAPALEAHLAGCEACRGFLADLRESQGAVRALAAEPLAEELLLAVRAAVRRRLATRRTPHPWRWAAAAVVAFLAVGGSWLLWRTPVAPISTPRGEGRPPQTARSAGARPLPAPAVPLPELGAVSPPRLLPPARPNARSTLRMARAVSPGVAHTTTAPTLSQEDADQLARAVVAVSRIERVTDTDPEPATPSTWVRLTTDDPKVVIYWQLDSNGGT